MEFYVYVLLLVLLQVYYIWSKISESRSSLVKVVLILHSLFFIPISTTFPPLTREL